MTAAELAYLTDRYLGGDATPEELERLQQWYMDGVQDNKEVHLPPAYSADQLMEQILYEKIRAAAGIPAEQAQLRRLNPIRWVAAAAVILFILGGTAWWIMSDTKSPAVTAGIPKQHIGTDVLPGFDGAVLTLADGSSVILDTTANGKLAVPGTAGLTKKEGQLIYDAGTATEAMTFNTLRTPRGRKFELVLADGTQVWLDAASSITYPVAFSSKERRVSITGQAYFEVTKDPAKPFKVDMNGKGEVEVLGTHFNVNSYDPMILVTLLEGSVEVKNQTSKVKIIPGEQAKVHPDNGQLTTDNRTDLEQVMAWKNGFTSFRGAGIEEIMQQVSRWYDVDVEYRGDFRGRTFTADVSRNIKLSQLLKILEASNIHFRIEGRQLIVLP